MEGKTGLLNAFFPLNLFLTEASPSKKAVAMWPKAIELLRPNEGVCTPDAAALDCVVFTASSSWEVS